MKTLTMETQKCNCLFIYLAYIYTMQAIANQSGNPPTLNIEIGDKITVPLRCACPTKNQTDIGIKYLISYLTDEDDDDWTMSVDFGIDNDLFLKANRLTHMLDDTIYPSTTVLIPLETLPSKVYQTIRPPTSPPPPPPPKSAVLPSSPSSSNNTRVYALVGGIVAGFFLLILAITFIYFYFRFRKGKSKKNIEDPVIVSKSFATTESSSVYQDVLKQVRASDLVESIKVYDLEELKHGTDNFSTTSVIEGSVYRGTIDGKLVAIKKLEGDVSKEINLLQRINHSNLVGMAGICFDEGQWHIVYEYVFNGSLSDWLFKNEDVRFLSWTQRIQIALDVATGLNYLHSFTNPTYVHKDIKSSNILLDSDFRAKIANFALARPMKAQEGEFSVTNHIVGTIGYVAPEYLANGLVSTKLDVYAFGVVLLEMVTGKEIFVLYEEHKNNLANLLDGLVSDEGKEKSLRKFVDVSLEENYPDEVVVLVVRIIDGCLKKNPEVRPTMDEIVQFLTKALSLSIDWELSNVLNGDGGK